MAKLKVGICGYGGLGRVHVGSMLKMDDVEIVAICDNNPKKLEPVEIKINIEHNGPVFDIGSCRTYLDFKKMLKQERLDAVVTALPTHIHAKYAIMAMNQGIHVFSEKPMALNVRACDTMIKARDANRVQLQVGQCLRFWPEYEMLKKAVVEKTYGPLRSLTMTRIGGYSTWADPNWFNDGKLSGGAILDLHLHDVDWVQHALGPPKALLAAGSKGITGAIDDVAAIWQYEDFIVSIRGSWMYQTFSMSFQAFFENAAMDFGVHPDTALRVKVRGENDFRKVELPSTDNGYLRELACFFDCIRGTGANTICTAESTRESVRLVMLENRSIVRQKWMTPAS
jgi:predicted dehydrogenase